MLSIITEEVIIEIGSILADLIDIIMNHDSEADANVRNVILVIIIKRFEARIILRNNIFSSNDLYNLPSKEQRELKIQLMSNLCIEQKIDVIPHFSIFEIIETR